MCIHIHHTLGTEFQGKVFSEKILLQNKLVRRRKKNKPLKPTLLKKNKSPKGLCSFLTEQNTKFKSNESI